MMISEKIARAANLPQVANSARGTIKILPTRRTSRTVRLQSVDQKLAARRRNLLRRPNPPSPDFTSAKVPGDNRAFAPGSDVNIDHADSSQDWIGDRPKLISRRC